MMDTSDGLQDAIFKLSKASNLEFDIETIPAGKDLKTTFPKDWKDYALWGGEDFELIFTIPPCLYKYFNNPQFIKIGTVSDRPFSNALEKEFERRYKKETEVRGKKCFAVREDEFFIVSGLSWANAIVLEHAFSKTEVEKNMFEDGKLFYMEEMNEKEMFEKMIEEIEG